MMHTDVQELQVACHSPLRREYLVSVHCTGALLPSDQNPPFTTLTTMIPKERIVLLKLELHLLLA